MIRSDANEDVLRQWRTKILNRFLVVVTIAALPAWLMTVVSSLQIPDRWHFSFLFSVGFVVLVGLALFRNLDSRMRAWGVLLVGYAMATTNMALGGLRGAGPWYMLVLPILGFILIGIRSGVLMSFLSAVILAVFVFLFDQGVLVEWDYSTTSPWVNYSTLLMLLAIVMVLLVLFQRFQLKLIEDERLAHSELKRTQALLEQNNVTLEQKVKERTEELLQSNKVQAALYQITDAANASHDMQEFYQHIHRIIGELMYAGNIFIALYDETSGLLSFPYFVDEKDGPFPTQPLEDFHGMTSYVIRTGNSIHHGWDQFSQLVESHEIELQGSYNVDGIGAPLKSDGKILGAIFVQSYAEGVHYTDQDDEILAFVAQHIATALTRLRALEEERKRTAELAILNNVSEAMSRTLDVKTMTRLVGDKLREIFASESAMILLLDRGTNLIHTYYEYDENEGGYIDYVEPFPLGTGLSSKVILTGKPLLLGTLEEEIANGAYFPPEIIEQGSGFFSQSWLGVPIMVNERSLGLVALADGRPHAFNENHLRLLQTLSANMGVAIENGRLFQDVQQRVAELAVVNTVSAALVSELDLDALIQLVGSQTRSIFNADIAYVAMLDETSATIHFPYTYGEKLTSIQYGEGLTSKVIQTNQPILINQEADRQNLDIGDSIIGIKSLSYLGVPISVSGKAVGVISVQSTHQEGIFDDNDLHLLNTIAANVSTAFQNARLFANLQSQKKFSETLIHTSPVAIVILDAENRVSSWNPAAERLFGYTQAEARDRSIIDLVSDDESRPELLEFSRMISQGKSVHSFVRRRSRDGRDLDLELFAVPVIFEENRAGTFVIYHDITERIQVENDLRESNEKLRLIFESAFDGISVYEEFPSEGKRILMDCNERYCQMAGRSKDELLAISDTRSIQHSIENAPENEDQESVVAEQTFSGVFTWLRPDGKENIIEYNAAPTKVGDRYFTIGLDRDITDRKIAEEALRKSEHLYRSVIDNSVDVFYRADREGNIVLASPSGASLLGYDSVQDLIGLNLLRDVYANPEDRKPLLAEIQKHGFVRNFETKIRRRDGTPITVLVNSRAYVDENGETLGIEGFLRDFSDRKQMEDALREAKAEAEQANHAKSAFLANMSHELRTPLNAIIGFTRIVRRKAEGALPEKQIENLEKVLISADHLLNLINTILDIAKIEAGRMDVLAANFRIGALIDLCANTAQPLVKPDVVLEKQVDESLYTIYSDQDKIRQIILNLLSNAAKFTHAGKIILSAERDGEDKLRIAVSDTGIGISDDALPHIFKEFQQADSSTTRKYGGTGLGLSISRNLARLLGGDLTVESELGKGSTFTLSLPVQYRSQTLAALETSPEIIAEQESAPVQGDKHSEEISSGRKLVLVIDDDPDAVYLLRENLSQDEFEIIGSRSGEDGIRMARQQQPQAILLDILLPEADGWQVLHDLKNDPAVSHIPVILLTIVDKKALGFRLGAQAYLLKPLDPVAVRDALNKVVGPDRSRPWNVLVVDDDPNVADMLRQFLPESDFKLDAALDGVAALQAIRAERPDIILLDIIMPRLDGFGVIESLRADPKTCDLPIIVISAKELTAAESTRLKETVSLVMKKQGFQGEKLAAEINLVLKNNTPHTPALA